MHGECVCFMHCHVCLLFRKHYDTYTGQKKKIIIDIACNSSNQVLATTPLAAIPRRMHRI